MSGHLTTRQRVFVEEYLQCSVGSEAARRAGYSVKTAQQQASRLLSNVVVKQHIERRIAELKATTDEVLLRLASHSRSTMDDFLAGSYLSIRQARERGKMHLVKKYRDTATTEYKTTGEAVETHHIEIELYDAQAATVQLAKILGLFVEHVEVTTWRDKVIAALREKKVTPADVRAELGDDLATELFVAAGVPVSESGEAAQAGEQAGVPRGSQGDPDVPAA